MGYPKIAILIGFAGNIFFDQNDSVNDPTWPRIPSNEQRRGTPCVDNFPRKPWVLQIYVTLPNRAYRGTFSFSKSCARWSYWKASCGPLPPPTKPMPSTTLRMSGRKNAGLLAVLAMAFGDSSVSRDLKMGYPNTRKPGLRKSYSTQSAISWCITEFERHSNVGVNRAVWKKTTRHVFWDCVNQSKLVVREARERREQTSYLGSAKLNIIKYQLLEYWK